MRSKETTTCCCCCCCCCCFNVMYKGSRQEGGYLLPRLYWLKRGYLRPWIWCQKLFNFVNVLYPYNNRFVLNFIYSYCRIFIFGQFLYIVVPPPLLPMLYKTLYLTRLWQTPNKGFLGGSPGLVVMKWDSCSEGHGFESQHHILDGHFFTFICCKNCIVCLKKTENKRKRGREWPIF